MDTPVKKKPLTTSHQLLATSGKKIRKVQINQHNINLHSQIIKNYSPMVVLYQAEEAGTLIRRSHQDRVQNAISKIHQCELAIKKSLEKQQLLKRIESMKAEKGMRRLAKQQLEKVWQRKKQEKRSHLNIRDSQRKEDSSLGIELITIEGAFSNQINSAELRLKMKTRQIKDADSQMVRLMAERESLREEQGRKREEIAVSIDKLKQQKYEYGLFARHTDQIRHRLSQGTIEISVLSMQIKPEIRVFFQLHAHNNDNYKQMLLNDSGFHWNKKLRTKTMAPEELKYFMVIRLYRGWRKILKEWCCSFRGFHQLFFWNGQKKEGQADLKNFLPGKPEEEGHRHRARWTTRRKLHFLIIHTQREESYLEFLQTIRDLDGLNNGIIHITAVSLAPTEEEDQLEVNIDYEYMGQTRNKEFFVVRLWEVSREKVSKYLASDKVTLMKIEAPLAYESMADRTRYQEVYEMLKRAAK